MRHCKLQVTNYHFSPARMRNCQATVKLLVLSCISYEGKVWTGKRRNGMYSSDRLTPSGKNETAALTWSIMTSPDLPLLAIKEG